MVNAEGGAGTIADDDRDQAPRPPDRRIEAEDPWVRKGLVPGPDPLTHVQRGIVVYREMLSFEQEILERMRRWARSRPDSLRRAIEASDIEPMEALLEQFRERLSFWQERERQLNQD